MNGSFTTEHCEVGLETPAGRITTSVEIPTGFVPVTAILPLARQLAAHSQQLDVDQVRQGGGTISCRQGCAACCRMLVPMSPPEAFALRTYVSELPEERRQALQVRLDRTIDALNAAGLYEPLEAVAETDRVVSDPELEPLNQAYYALRLPCPFLESEQCTIYEARPAACRELLVTTPSEWCSNMAENPVASVPVSIRMSTALGLLWSTIRQEAPRLIPLPVSLQWAERHLSAQTTGDRGTAILESFLDRLWRLLSQEFRARGPTPPHCDDNP
ncbi:hypothetical protein YTPLAS18_34340 [Nitrospira sp.]|nr:hypothetical protein YTPLAS18_34340 [Nitrospira sp.]